MGHTYNGSYDAAHLDRIAFPIGGIGAGMFCIEGRGAASHMSIMNEPDIFNEPAMFAAISIPDIENGARVLEGPVPTWKYFGNPGSGNGSSGKTYGLPRFEDAVFRSHFPFAEIALTDPDLPLDVSIDAFSPFIPGNADDSSLPVGSFYYTFTNTTGRDTEAVFSYHALNFLPGDPAGKRVETLDNGFVLRSESSSKEAASFAVACENDRAAIDGQLFRGGWFDALTLIWKHVEEGDVICNDALPTSEPTPSPGGSIYLPVNIKANQSATVRVLFSWYVPYSRVSHKPQDTEGCGPECDCAQDSARAYHRPWYADQFEGVKDVLGYWRREETRLRQESQTFSTCFYDTTLPPEVVEAVAANLTILKSPTCLRQPDGSFWAWEGCTDSSGCCPGSCTHVWNYAQALPHLFPDLERSMREIEFTKNQTADGVQGFRALLPVSEIPRELIDKQAADGQLGGIMKIYRDYRISGNVDWLQKLWPRVKDSLEFCIREWDPDEEGALTEPHHNTYDIEFWGPNGMCTSFYCGALFAAQKMATHLNDTKAQKRYQHLYEKSKAYLEGPLFNGEYFIQNIRWTDLHAPDPSQLQSWSVNYSAEAVAVMSNEGPKYQYGSGCLSDGILGVWIAEMAGLPQIVDQGKVTSHLDAVHRYNLKRDLSRHANPQRPTFALGKEGGLLLCSWPENDQPTLPFVYSNEVWTGIEYQVASHLIISGEVDKGLEIVRTARNRYTGEIRNPFNEYECGHWYARAMASYGLLYALTGVRYDAVEKTLYVKPTIPGDFRVFLSTATGYGTVSTTNGEVAVHVVSGTIDIDEMVVG